MAGDRFRQHTQEMFSIKCKFQQSVSLKFLNAHLNFRNMVFRKSRYG